MPRTDVEPLASCELTHRVEEHDLASRLRIAGSGEFPPVYATSRMIALMESAAAKCLEPLLDPGELSVGVTVEVKHTAPSPSGVDVTASARFVGRDGKLFRFEVAARDPAGEIGTGTHLRAIVQIDRIVQGAERRRGA